MSEITPIEVEQIFDDDLYNDLINENWAWEPLEIEKDNNTHQNKNNQNKNKFNTNSKYMSDNQNKDHNQHHGEKKFKKWIDYFMIILILSILLNFYFLFSNLIYGLDYQVQSLYQENQKSYTKLQSIQNVLNWKWLLQLKK